MSSLEPDLPAPLGALVREYRGRGVLLDANLLVLYVVGRHDRRLVRSLKATRQFDERDVAFVVGWVALFDRVVTTPHVLTEVNGLLNTGLPGRLRWDVLASFESEIGGVVEVTDAARRIAGDPAFRRLGLTDAAILALGEGGPLTVSVDLDLCVALESRGLGVLNYNHVRFSI